MKPDRDEKNGALAHPKQRSRRQIRRRSAGDLESLRRELWHALRTLGNALDDPDATIADLTRVANSLAALGNAYKNATEVSDLAQRIERLETAQKGGRA